MGLSKDYKNLVARGFKVRDPIILRIKVFIPLKVKVPSGLFRPGRILTLLDLRYASLNRLLEVSIPLKIKVPSSLFRLG